MIIIVGDLKRERSAEHKSRCVALYCIFKGYCDELPISSGQTALPPKVDRRSLLHGGFVCESRYFRLDYKTQNVPSLQVRAVMENL